MLGYDRKLYMLPFDHRGSFAEKLLGVANPNAEQVDTIIELKKIIYEAAYQGIYQGIPVPEVGILCDEEYGEAVLQDSAKKGLAFAVCVEKSGQDEFMFEYGEDFRDHLARFQPTFAKALVRYNPGGDTELNMRQLERLKELSDYCQESGTKLLVEPLVIATPEQLAECEGDQTRYDQEMRIGLMVQMVQEFHQAGIMVDVWKIEGLADPAQYQRFMDEARSGEGREGVVAIVLGRGAELPVVEQWLRAGSEVDGVIGFAVGRTIFHEPLVEFLAGKMTREETVAEIGRRYYHLYQVFEDQI